MSLYGQFQRLLHDIDHTADALQEMSRFTRRRAEEQRAIIDQLANLTNSLTTGDKAAIQTQYARDAHERANRELARARYRLQNMHTTADMLWEGGSKLKTIANEMHGPILGGLGLVPEPIIDFLGDHLGIRVPSLEEILQRGEACMPRLAAHWEWNADAAMNFLQGLGSILHFPGLGGGPLDINVQQMHANGSLALAPIDHHAATMANQVQQTHAQARAQVDSKGSTITPDPYQPPPPPPDGSTTLSDAEIQRRAKALHDNLSQTWDFPMVEQLLEGLSPADVQALYHVYGTSYHHDLLTDLHNQWKSRYAYFTYRIDQLIAPDRINDQGGLLPVDPSQPYITAEPPTEEIAADTKTVTFSVKGLAKHQHYRLFYIGPDGKWYILPDRPDLNLQAWFPKEGQYTIVAEIDQEGGGNPTYVTLTENVVSRRTFALDVLHATSIWQPLESSQEYIQGLQKALEHPKDDHTRDILKESLVDAQNYLPDIDKSVPFAASFLPDQTSSPVPLRLYAKQLPDGSWVLVDLSIPGHPQEYPSPSSTLNGKPIGEHGERSIEDAWNKDFLHGNPYGPGLFTAKPPNGPASSTAVWQDDNQLNVLQYALNWLTNGSALFLIGGVLSLFPPTQLIGDALLFVGGVMVLAQSLQNVNNRISQYGLPLVDSDPGSWIDPLVIATSLLGAGFAMRAVRIGGETVYALDASASSSPALINALAKYHGVVLLSAQNALMIQQILASDMSSDEKAQQISQILAMGGIIYGGGFLRNVPIYTDDQKGITDHLIQMLMDTSYEDGLHITNVEGFQTALNDPAMRQALLTYLGPQMGTVDSPPKSVDFSKVDAATLRSQLINAWNSYQDALKNNKTELTFNQWLFSDRTTGDPDKFTRFQRMRYDAAILRAQSNPNIDPLLLQALQQGKGLQVDPTGKVTPVDGAGNDLRLRLVNDGFNIDDLNQRWKAYQDGRKNRGLTTSTFSEYLAQVNIGSDIGATPAKQPLSSLGLDPTKSADIQRYLYATRYHDLSQWLQDDPKYAKLKDDIDAFLNNPPTTGDWGSLSNDSDVNALQRDFIYRFNDMVGKDLGQMLQSGQISGQEFALLMRLINPMISVDPVTGEPLSDTSSPGQGKGGIIGAVGESVDVGYSNGNGFFTGNVLRAQMLDSLTEDQLKLIQKAEGLSDYQFKLLLNRARDSKKMTVPEFKKLISEAYPEKVKDGSFDQFFTSSFTDKLLAEKVTVNVTVLADYRQQLALERDNQIRKAKGEPLWKSINDPGWAARWTEIERARVRSYPDYKNWTDAQVDAFLAQETVQPDLVQGQPPTIRDDKTGYPTGSVDPFQYECYRAIVKMSEQAFDPSDPFYNSDQGKTLRDQLQSMGINEPIKSVSYLFITNGTSDAKASAYKAWNRLSGMDLRFADRYLRVYYLGLDGKVHLITSNSTDEIVSSYPRPNQP